MYEGVCAEMVYANKFNENSDLSTTYLGQTKMTRDKDQGRRKISYYQSRICFRKNYWMAQNVKYCWTQVPQNPTCQGLTICNAKPYMHYQNFLLTLRKFK